MLAVSPRIYDRADVMVSPDSLAMNFLLDRSAALRNAEIAALRETHGACRVAPPVTTDNALAGSFDFECDKGKLKIELILAPTSGDRIQKLEFVPAP
jgi:hypothetical protein